MVNYTRRRKTNLRNNVKVSKSLKNQRDNKRPDKERLKGELNKSNSKKKDESIFSGIYSSVERFFSNLI